MQLSANYALSPTPEVCKLFRPLTMPLLLEFPKINVLLLSVPFYSLYIPPVTWLTVIINTYFLKWNDGCFLFQWEHGSNEKRIPKYPLHLYISLPIYSTLSCYCELFMLLSKANLSSYPLDHIILLYQIFCLYWIILQWA